MDHESNDSNGEQNAIRASGFSSSSNKIRSVEIEHHTRNDFISSILMFPVVVILNVISSLSDTIKHGFDEFVFECSPNCSASGESISRIWKVTSLATTCTLFLSIHLYICMLSTL